MTHTLSDRPRRTRPARAPRVLVTLVVLTGLLAGCSDAHTAAEKDQAEAATDPRVVTVFQPPELLAAMKALALAFGQDHPDVAFVHESDNSNALARRVDRGAVPSIWIDLARIVDTYAGDARTQGPPIDVGNNVLQFVVRKANPKGIHSITVFGPDGGPYPGALTGLCQRDTQCGSVAGKYLVNQKVDATPSTRAADGDALARSIVAGTLDAALVYRTSSAPLGAQLDVEPLDPPSSGLIDYHMLRFTTSTTAAEFETWLNTDAAKAILLTQGLLPMIDSGSG